jgi:hypothetical protein
LAVKKVKCDNGQTLTEALRKAKHGTRYRSQAPVMNE